MKERLATLISGSGTTMEQIVKACQSGEVPMDIACVISSNPKAGGIEKAWKLGIPVEDIVIVDPNDFRGDDKKVDQEGFGARLLKELGDRGTTIVTQNGWLPLTPETVIDKYQDAIFNQHPGPVPEFGGPGMYGRRVHASVILFRRMTGHDMWTEVIAQRVDPKYDRGVVVQSARVGIMPEDTVDDLQKRALPVEHQVQISLLQDVVSGNIQERRRVGPLVRLGEERILFLARKVGKLLYPQG